MTTINDMPKLGSPFVRAIKNGEYVVTDEIAKGHEAVATEYSDKKM